MPETDELVKVLFQVNDDTFEAMGTERVWAKPLGDDLYEIRNTPWHTCDINWGDIVKAVSENENEWPTIVDIVRRSGHRTIHIFFFKETTEVQKGEILGGLKSRKASYENANGRMYAVDIEPDGDFSGLCTYLGEFEIQGKLDYRTVVRPAPH
ncbi:MAG: DUF4265 domain-containing protein [Acidobacteriia bacterium]|nr:DUF4265 domain-containing protein [Terriglobia bacterium]